MTPVQYWVYGDMGIDSDVAIRMAFATDLFVILPAAAASAWGHHRRRAVWWRPAIIMGLCGLAASFAGATLAANVSAGPLKTVFGATVLIIGLRMVVAVPPADSTRPRENVLLWAACAVPVSFMAGLIGVGGGVFLVPIMVLLFRFPMHTTIATSAAVIAMISIGGIAGYILHGSDVPGIPSPSLGYVYIAAWLPLIGTSIIMTQVGVRIAHALPARTLAWIFAVVAVYIGLRMIGVFQWLGLPL